MGSKKKTTVGHRYFMGLHMGLCRGEVDELVAIKVGDRTAWQGSVTGNASITISEPNLFGGDDKEGGIAGRLDVMMGGPTQPTNAALAQMLGGLVPAFRGFVSTFFDGLVGSGSPYPKPWAYRVRRALKGWGSEGPWYPERAVVSLAGGAIKAMNPAHILYQCFTSTDWGRGLPRARLDDVAWRAAADRLFTEGFGMCMRWNRQDTLSAFMQIVLDHIGGARYVDRQSGLIVLKLIRDDYDPALLPLFTSNSGLLAIDDDDAGAQTAGTNEVLVKYRDPIANEERQVRVKNLASIHSPGVGVASSTREYPGLPTAELALRVAQRDLKASSGFIKKFKVRLDRRGYQLAPGSVFRIADLRRGIDNMVLRAGRVEYGTLTEGTITITALQDVFGLPATSYVAVQAPGYVPPSLNPVAVVNRRLVELPYREIAQTTDAANLAVLHATACYLGAVAARPNGLCLSFDLVDRVGASGSFVNRGEGAFCPSGVLAGAMTHTTTAVTLSAGDGLEDVALGTAALIDDEMVRVDAINPTTGAMTVARGCADTVPVPHAAGARVWFFDDFSTSDPTEYSPGVSLQAKLLTRTSTGVLTESAAATDTLVTSQRQHRPYPPGRLLLNTASYPVSVAGPVVISWTHRDRVVQADQLIDTSQGNVGPEAGTTYRVRLFRGTALKRTYSGISGTSQTYTLADEAADGGPFIPLRVVVESERGGLVSAQAHDFTVDRTGLAAAPPVRSSVTATAFAADSTAHLVNLPAVAAAGDLLLLHFVNDGAATVATPAGWTLLGSTANGTAVRSTWFYRLASGSEGGTVVDLATSSAEQAVAQVHRIAAGSFDASRAPAIATATGTSTVPNPPALAPAWGADDTLWLCGYGADDDDAPTDFPFPGSAYQPSGTGADTCSVGSCLVAWPFASLDPAAFTIGDAEEWVASTVAIAAA